MLESRANIEKAFLSPKTIMGRKEIDVPKDVGELLMSLSNKTNDIGSSSSGNVKSNITFVKPSVGTFVTKKIMITNLNPKKIRNIEAAAAELIESSDSSDSESDMD
ncbi:unnamed protein product [Vicia faba]|uniref:Uncharacterized protein n=1 Tax=Vicia faba TaxID=3906 RepID=A0AAV1A2V7_VICFA|nr:unnamed protein product [Vicia faba]